MTTSAANHPPEVSGSGQEKSNKAGDIRSDNIQRLLRDLDMMVEAETRLL